MHLVQPTIDRLFQKRRLESEDIALMDKTGVWNESSPIPPERLSLLRLSYWDFEGHSHGSGEMMVLDAVADSVLHIFRTLYDQKFPISKIRLMHEYQGEDTRSMEDNNSSCYNCRPVVGGSALSLHSYGLAIDINPVQNPFIYFPDEAPGLAIYSPKKSRAYANRLNMRPGKTFRPGMAEEVVDIFYQNGFTVWGGHWDTPIDYQHFQVSRNLAEILALMTPEEAKLFYKAHLDFSKEGLDICQLIQAECSLLFTKTISLSHFYHQEKELFFRILQQLWKMD